MNKNKEEKQKFEIGKIDLYGDLASTNLPSPSAAGNLIGPNYFQDNVPKVKFDPFTPFDINQPNANFKPNPDDLPPPSFKTTLVENKVPEFPDCGDPTVQRKMRVFPYNIDWVKKE